jgi:hypothetical protein
MRLLLASIALLLAACIPLGRGAVFTSMVVTAKTQDGYLVSATGEKCHASTPRLAAASLGSSVRCVWVTTTENRLQGRLPLPPAPHP